MPDQLPDKRMIEISKQNPEEIYTCEDGRIIFNGNIFNDKKHFDMSINLTAKTVKFLNFFKRKKN